METKKNFFAKIGDKFKAYFASLKQRHEAFKLLPAKDQKRWWSNTLLDNAIYIFIVIFIIITAIIKPSFMSMSAVTLIIQQTAAYLPMALGIAGCIVLAGTDLSAGKVVGLTACVTASLLQSSGVVSKVWPNLDGGLPILVVLLIAITVGMLVGLFNGFFISKFKVHPFIVTLATQLMVYGFLLIYLTWGTNNSQTIGSLTETFKTVVKGTAFSIGDLKIQWYVIYAVVVTVIIWFLWNKTKLGKNMFAVGANPEAAKVSGVNVAMVTLVVFAFAGLMYGYTGFIESARIGSNSAATGFNYEFDAISAAVIGGVSFSGGVGKIGGVVLGVFLLRIIFVALIYLGVDTNWQYIIKGAIILAACTLDMRKYAVKR